MKSDSQTPGNQTALEKTVLSPSSIETTEKLNIMTFEEEMNDSRGWPEGEEPINPSMKTSKVEGLSETKSAEIEIDSEEIDVLIAYHQSRIDALKKAPQ